MYHAISLLEVNRLLCSSFYLISNGSGSFSDFIYFHDHNNIIAIIISIAVIIIISTIRALGVFI